MEERRTPMWLRVLAVALGLLGLTAGILILFFPDIGISTTVVLMAWAFLFLGIVRLTTSVAQPRLPAWLRALGVVVGLLAITLWIVILVFPGFGVALILAFLAGALIFYGIERIAVGGMDQNAVGWTRGLAIVVGVLLIIFGILVLLFPSGFGVATAVVFFSIALIVAGLSAIASGVADKPMLAMVTDAV